MAYPPSTCCLLRIDGARCRDHRMERDNIPTPRLPATRFRYYWENGTKLEWSFWPRAYQIHSEVVSAVGVQLKLQQRQLHNSSSASKLENGWPGISLVKQLRVRLVCLELRAPACVRWCAWCAEWHIDMLLILR